MKKNRDVLINYVEKANDFVGIKIKNNKVQLYVPQMFRIDQSYTKDVFIFLKSLSLSSAIKKENIKKGKDLTKEIWPFDSYLWIIKDFIENGFYYNREKVYSSNCGKIEWKKTMKNIPIYSDENLIYDKLITSKMSATNDIIAQIYKLCLKQSIDKIGWLFNYNVQIDIQQIISKKEMIYKIKQEFINTNDDIRKIRFKHMLKILTNTEGQNMISSFYSYGIENYYYVYERMIDIYFKGIKGKEKEKYNPNGYWQLNNRELYKASSLRPDTILKNNGKTFIIDAKMYQYGATHNIEDLPNAQSMQKQITYGDYVFNVLNEKDIKNIFILPYNKELPEFKEDNNIFYFNNSNFAYIGYAFVDWRNLKSINDYDYIHTFLIDFNYLLENYNNSDNNSINNFCSFVDNV